ncbi:ABC transporter permease subunit [Anaerocolumna sedimenticola]|uniref:ABC transporter permease subunit n=2 Tax=Anaerocolumna sedimenticola TaxID=2696063 RepID=A0A6P1TGA8_9FIRM|nr:ABC transporter permease subunit [Anaerocolumna sedimenticola]
MNRMLGNKKAILIFTMPTLIVFTVFVFYPVFQTFYRSFFEWDGITDAVFTGLNNYKELFQDDLFYESLRNGMIFAGILLTVQVGLATLLTFALMNHKIRGKRFFRTAFFIPVVLSVTVVCQLWAAIYNPEFGLINHVFELLGMSYRQNWLSDMKLAIIAVTFVNVWQYTGYQFAIIYAGAKSIPEDYLEAARIDGASNWKINTRIILPLLKDTYRMCFIFAATGGLNAFAHMNLLTKGGPGTSTYTLTYMTFRSAFTVSEFGYGCTSAVILVLQCLIATILVNKIFSLKESATY